LTNETDTFRAAAGTEPAVDLTDVQSLVFPCPQVHGGVFDSNEVLKSRLRSLCVPTLGPNVLSNYVRTRACLLNLPRHRGPSAKGTLRERRRRDLVPSLTVVKLVATSRRHRRNDTGMQHYTT